jgi:hypothetical protein
MAAALSVVLFLLAHPGPCLADTAVAANSADLGGELAELKAEADTQKQQLKVQQNQIEALRMMVESQAVLLRRAGLDGVSGGPRDPTRIRLISDSSEPAEAGAQPQGGATADRPKSQRAADQLLVEAGGVLLPPWVFQVEPSLDETHVSNPRVNIFGYTVFDAINIGTIRVDDISQDVIDSNLSLRLGLPHRFQVDLRVPFTTAFITQTKGIGTGNISQIYTQGRHLGDIQGTLSWQPIVERDWIPAVVLRTRVTVPTGESVFQIPETYPSPANGAETQLIRAPTGSGYYSIEPGFTLVWRSDPLVLFAGASYSYHLQTPDYAVSLLNPAPSPGQPSVTRVDHGILAVGNVLQLNAGLNFAVNERASINFSFVDLYEDYTQQRTPTTHFTKLLGTSVNDARLGLGASFGLTDNVALVLNAGIGLTDQSPGYTFAVSVPITLPLRR